MKRIFVMILIFIILLTSIQNISSNNTVNIEQPWPQSGHDERNTGLSQFNTSKVDGTITWKQNYSQPFNSPPIIDFEGNIYLTTLGGYEGETYGYYGKSKFIRLNKEGQIEVKHTVGYISSNTLAIYEDTIYFVSREENGGYNLTALSKDMDIKWKYHLKESIANPPVIGNDGRIYVPDTEILYSINTNGDLEWKWNASEYISLYDESWEEYPPISITQPSISKEGEIFFGFNGNLVCIDDKGESKWFTPGSAFLRPMVDEDGNLYVTIITYKSKKSYIFSLHQNGTTRWNLSTNNEILSSTSLGSDGMIYVTGNKNMQDSGFLLAVDKDGNEKWRFDTPSYLRTTKSPIIGSDGTIYFGTQKGLFRDNGSDMLFAVNPDGTLKWNYSIDAGIDISHSIGPDGTVYFVSGSTIYAFGPKTSDDENTPSLISPVFFATIVSLAIIYELRKTKKPR